VTPGTTAGARDWAALIGKQTVLFFFIDPEPRLE
jgi:hypothetical protein